MSEAPNTTTAIATQNADEKKMRAERDIQAGALIAFAGAGGMIPVTYEQLVIVAKTIAASGYFKDATNFAAVITKIQYGAELGIPIMAALNNIDIIEGRPSLRSALVAARIKASGHVRYKIVKWDNTECVIEWRRKYEEEWVEEGVSSWNREDSKTAGLMKDKSNHEKFFRAMAFARAITQGARAYCPDLFFGAVYDPDELREEVAHEKAVNDPPAESGADRLRAAVAKAGGELKPDSSGSPIVDVLESPPQKTERVSAKKEREAAKAAAGKSTETQSASPAVAQPAPQPSPSPTPSVSAPPATVEAPTVTQPASPAMSTPAPGPLTETAPTATIASSGGSSSTPTPVEAEVKTPDPTQASTAGPEASTPVTSTSTAAVEPPRPLPTTASSEPASSTPSSPPSTPTDGGDKLAAALASIPDEPKKHAEHFKEHRGGMSDAEQNLLRQTIRVYAATIRGEDLGWATITDEQIDLAETGVALATKAGATFGERVTAAIAKVRKQRNPTDDLG